MNQRRQLRRGTVWRVRLDPIEGSEQGGTRPALVISSNFLNDPLPIVTIAVISSRKTERVHATEVLVEPPEGGLTQRSKVLLYQVRTVSKTRVAEELGELSTGTMARVDVALRRAFGL